ncbi:MAG: DUF6580 family putative transport protein [Candidatus Porifericomitaceae bacterium WSBS_2022_MAG_OTU9]
MPEPISRIFSRHQVATAFLVLVIFAVASRVLPHPPNMTAVGAVGLYAGASLHGSSRWLAPLAALLVSDALLGFYSPLLLVFVYAGSLLALPCAKLSYVPACGAAALGFFAVSNFGVWLCGGMYQPNLTGFVNCYVAALPFLVGTVAGNLLYYPAMRYTSHFVLRRSRTASSF